MKNSGGIDTSKQELPEILDVKSIANTQIFHIERITLRFSNGVVRDFERLKVWEPGIIMIVAMPDSQTLLLVREYAAGINDYCLSFPKGRVEIGEDILTAANRELQEEVGYSASKLRYITAMTNAPNYSSTQMHLVLAQELSPSTLPADEPEPLVVVPWRIDEISALLARPDFHEARAIAALYVIKEHVMKQQ
jgi:ADP-ribose diphosphatase